MACLTLRINFNISNCINKTALKNHTKIKLREKSSDERPLGDTWEEKYMNNSNNKSRKEVCMES